MESKPNKNICAAVATDACKVKTQVTTEKVSEFYSTVFSMHLMRYIHIFLLDLALMIRNACPPKVKDLCLFRQNSLKKTEKEVQGVLFHSKCNGLARDFQNFFPRPVGK